MKVGTKVRLNQHYPSVPLTPGDTGWVYRVSGNFVFITWDGVRANRAMLDKFGENGGMWFALDPHLTVCTFDPARPLHHRDGRPAVYKSSDDPERPYLVQHAGLTLSLDREGQFYPNAESSFDLVNK